MAEKQSGRKVRWPMVISNEMGEAERRWENEGGHTTEQPVRPGEEIAGSRSLLKPSPASVSELACREGIASVLGKGNNTIQVSRLIGAASSSANRSDSPKSMKSSLRVRKQVYELTLSDLQEYPIWEFKLDEHGADKQDEATVQPHPASGALDPADRMFVVRAVFTLADGSRMTGYFTPPVRGSEGMGSLQPIIVTERGQVRLWCGTAEPDSKRLARCYDLLGKPSSRVFPLRFESDVALLGGPARGSVPGFLVLEDFQTRQTRTVI